MNEFLKKKKNKLDKIYKWIYNILIQEEKEMQKPEETIAYLEKRIEYLEKKIRILSKESFYTIDELQTRIAEIRDTIEYIKYGF